MLWILPGYRIECIEEHLIAECECIDAFLFELNGDSECFQFSDILKADRNVSSESRHRFCEYQIDLFQLAHSYHALEFGTVVRPHTADAFVCEDLNQFPIVFTVYQLGIVFDLSGVGVQLICRA